MAHIDNVWTDCRCQFGGEEAFLSDQLTIADAFYAPIVRRFRTYGIKLAGDVTAYVDALWIVQICRSGWTMPMMGTGLLKILRFDRKRE